MNFTITIISVVGAVACLLVGWRFRSLTASICVFVLMLALVAAVHTREQRVAIEANGPDSLARSPEPEAIGPSDPSSGRKTNPPFENLAQKIGFDLQDLKSLRPIEVTTHGFVGSDACRECHAENHATWAASYHRTMTQVATRDTVIGDFHNVNVQSQGQRFVLGVDGETCLAEIPDEKDPALRQSVPIVMTTGSHHMQVYWYATGSGRTLGMLPLVWLNEANEWIPRNSAFLAPPDGSMYHEMGRWNETCSCCHSTHRKGRRLASGEWDTHVGEFGISCEACHGPGEGHIAFHRGGSDQRDFSQARSSSQDQIVNPEKLSKVRSAQVCGQCHSVMDPLHLDLDYQENGHKYRAGMDLTETHGVWNRDSPGFEETRKTLDYPDLDTFLNETFYGDGMIRVSGREYNGLIESSCYLNGEMTCLSCHKMHKASDDERSLEQWADDQLKRIASDDQACLQCHQSKQYGPEHTHHLVGSSGSSCYNCHMPHTAYGLLKGIRNHKISSPDVGKDLAANRPNACNLCHLDKTLAWSAENLRDWYSIDPPDLDQDQERVAASLLWLLRGNAADRALVAWHMGWKEAQHASGNLWLVPFLSSLLDDQYDAIRLIARRSIQSIPGSEDFELDVVTSSTSQDRMEAGMDLMNDWLESMVAQLGHRPELLIEEGKGVRVDRIRQLIDQRDHTPIILSE